jgi:cellulose synthase/poly-beta-1,6-N-acetylglucosamine synthase-like glycosyltransferase
MKALPRLSVVVPVLNGREVLPLSTGALMRSDLPRDEWEFLLVDDGSSDGGGEWARDYADRVLTVTRGPRGPGYARNLGAVEATGDVLVFVDADVCIHAGVLRRFRDLFSEDEGLGAAFGSYDDRPSENDFLSQYRNLYHRYVHLQGAGEAATFWAGCGAVRRDLFLRLEGFDTEAFPRPQIEDIELGYRIRDAGYRIVLDPAIEGTHLKRWTLKGIVRTDLLDRGVPWMRLLLGTEREVSLNVGGTEKLKTGLLGVSFLFMILGLVLLDGRWGLASLLPLTALILMNAPVYRWFADLRGWGFALRVIPMNLLYYLIGGLSVVIAMTLHLFDSRPSPGGTTEVSG